MLSLAGDAAGKSALKNEIAARTETNIHFNVARCRILILLNNITLFIEGPIYSDLGVDGAFSDVVWFDPAGWISPRTIKTIGLTSVLSVKMRSLSI